MLSTDDLKSALPAHLKGAATQELADKVNNITQDPEFAQSIRENFISYTTVLKEGRFKLNDYLNAVAYVSYKIAGYTNQESYKRAFPGRYANLVAQGADDKTISAYVATYNKNKLVNLILEQTLIPSWVLNQDVYQKAIATQFELMTTANSEKVRCEAANSILTHLKRPEKAQVELTFGEAETSGMRDLKETLSLLAQQQQALISQGVNTRTIAHQKLGQALTQPHPLPALPGSAAGVGAGVDALFGVGEVIEAEVVSTTDHTTPHQTTSAQPTPKQVGGSNV